MSLLRRRPREIYRVLAPEDLFGLGDGTEHASLVDLDGSVSLAPARVSRTRNAVAALTCALIAGAVTVAVATVARRLHTSAPDSAASAQPVRRRESPQVAVASVAVQRSPRSDGPPPPVAQPTPADPSAMPVVAPAASGDWPARSSVHRPTGSRPATPAASTGVVAAAGAVARQLARATGAQASARSPGGAAVPTRGPHRGPAHRPAPATGLGAGPSTSGPAPSRPVQAEHPARPSAATAEPAAGASPATALPAASAPAPAPSPSPSPGPAPAPAPSPSPGSSGPPSPAGPSREPSGPPSPAPSPQRESTSPPSPAPPAASPSPAPTPAAQPTSHSPVAPAATTHRQFGFER